MSNPHTPSESKDIADRFRKLLDSDETKDINQITEESTMGEEDHDQLRNEEITEKTDIALHITPYESGPSISPDVTTQVE